MGDNRRAWELLTLINPLNHARTADAVSIYKVEPYVIAADVYAVPPHTGRGGWTWYTGAAGWCYRLIVESLLGLHREGGRLRMTPHMRDDWESYSVRYRFADTDYRILVTRTPPEAGAGGIRMTLDEVEQDAQGVLLENDHREHLIEVRVPHSD